MNFASWRSLERRLRPVPLRFTYTAGTPGNIRGYKHAGSCLVLSYRIDDPRVPFSSEHSDDQEFLTSNFGGSGGNVFVNVVSRPYFQLVANGALARVINYHLVNHSKTERALYKAAKEAAAKAGDSVAEEPISANDDSLPLFVGEEQQQQQQQDDRSARLLAMKHNLLDTFASRSEEYLKKTLSIAPHALPAALNYALYKHAAVRSEFSRYIAGGGHTKSELSDYSKKLYQTYVKGLDYTFVSYDCRSVGYHDGNVFLPLRISVPKQCRLGIAFDITQYDLPACLLTDHDLKPSRYNITLDRTGEQGFYVQLVYWFKGERMRLYHRIYSEDTPGVNFFHYIKGVSVGI